MTNCRNFYRHLLCFARSGAILMSAIVYCVSIFSRPAVGVAAWRRPHALWFQMNDPRRARGTKINVPWPQRCGSRRQTAVAYACGLDGTTSADGRAYDQLPPAGGGGGNEMKGREGGARDLGDLPAAYRLKTSQDANPLTSSRACPTGGLQMTSALRG